MREGEQRRGLGGEGPARLQAAAAAAAAALANSHPRTSVLSSAKLPSSPSRHSLMVLSREPVSRAPSGVTQTALTCVPREYGVP